MGSDRIRVKVEAIFISEGRILVEKVYNESESVAWYVSPGGGVEFGETSLEALKREVKEELNWELDDAQSLGTFESIHTINGKSEHEIVFAFLIQATDPAWTDSGLISVSEPNGAKKVFQWRDLNEIRAENALLYPDGLFEAL